MYELKCEACFDSAHFLADYFGKCENLHGHRWRVEVTIGADALQGSGSEKDMVCDFGSFKKTVREVVSQFDHCFLVQEGTLSSRTLSALEDEGFEIKLLPFRTTAENLAKNFFDILTESGLPVVSVEVDETPNNRAVYKPKS